jgi:hypothetical protein
MGRLISSRAAVATRNKIKIKNTKRERERERVILEYGDAVID